MFYAESPKGLPLHSIIGIAVSAITLSPCLPKWLKLYSITDQIVSVLNPSVAKHIVAVAAPFTGEEIQSSPLGVALTGCRE